MERYYIYKRALAQLPKSYKIWKSFLIFRTSVVIDGFKDPVTGLQTRKLPLTHPEWALVNGEYESCLMLCNKFPVVWEMYLHFLMHQCNPTRTRRTFDKALKALPITQNSRIWKMYLEFAKQIGGIVGIKIWNRYLKLEPNALEAYVEMLKSIHPPKYAQAASVLVKIIENPVFKSKKTKYEFWTELVDLICDHAQDMDMDILNAQDGDDQQGIAGKLNVENVLRAGILLFTDQVGRAWVYLIQLWNGLAQYFILKGEFERARDVYEEALRKVTVSFIFKYVQTVRDFTLVFDAYAKIEEALLVAKMQEMEESGQGDAVQIDMRMARFEKLLDSRPFLVNDVLLRQNPHNIATWDKRIDLFLALGNDDKTISAFNDAFARIHARKAIGKLDALWNRFAAFYEAKEDYEGVRRVYERAIKQNFKRVDDLAQVWCFWAEFEIRIGNFGGALDVMARATTPPKTRGLLLHNIKYSDESLSPQQRLFKSLKLWSFYVDLEESFGSVASTRIAYDRILELKIANAQIICNYAQFLQDQHCFEDVRLVLFQSYRIYERGIDLFGFPIAADLWTLYLNKFNERFKGDKLERARELFETVVETAPPKYAKQFYMLYAKHEEEFGLARHAMRIYDRATRAVDDSERFDTYLVYIAKAGELFGVVSTREIYQRAIETLPDRRARDMCLKFAQLELSLGEVDRARGVYAYGSQFSEPRTDPVYWKTWHEFEVSNGNEETFKEMLRIKRSVQAKFNTDVVYITAALMAKDSQEGNAVDPMKALEAESGSRVAGFVRAKETEKELPEKKPANPDEIVLNDSDSEEENEAPAVASSSKSLETRQVPSAVFGGLAEKVEDSTGKRKR